ncbi:MAG: serine hydrolase domain-containing protein [Verrucomicrobiota bacterium]
MNDEEQKNLWNELKCVWREHKPSAKPVLAADEQIAAMRKRMAKMHQGLNKADLWGSALYAVVTVPFIIYVFTTPYLIARIGYLIIIGGMLFASWKSLRRRRSIPQPLADASVMEWLKYDLEKVRQHAEDSRTLLWWYLLPFLIGMTVSTWGMPVGWTARIGTSILTLLIAVVTYRMNQRVWRTQWVPIQHELEVLLHFAPAASQPEPTKKNIIMQILLIGIVLISLGAIVFVRAKESKTHPVAYSDPLSQMLENIRAKHHFPALAASVVVDGKRVVTNAVGFRKKGGPEKISVNDKFHLGSVTKSMTATVAAMLVEQGKISWMTTIGEAFPELKSEIHPGYLDVTLEQLLSHRGGAPGDAPPDLWRKAWAAHGSAAEQRLDFIKGILARKPEAPGTKFIYSNQGYTIAGVMLEKATGKPWEDLLRTMLFEPLGMTTAGFGAPASVDQVDQPWGHTKAPLSEIKAVPPGPRADNPLAISPAGAVHCSIGDLANYAAFHMAGERGKSELLSAEYFKKLHTAVSDNNDYALGWVVLERGWANGRALMHNGSNTMFYIVVWMAPEKNSAVIVASNIGVNEAFEGCDEAARKLIEQYFGK